MNIQLFKKALKVLNIFDYQDIILDGCRTALWSDNPLSDYVELVHSHKYHLEDLEGFRDWFERALRYACEYWETPEYMCRFAKYYYLQDLSCIKEPEECELLF